MASTEFVDPYLDPETGLLRNKVGAQTKVALDEAEGDLSFARLVQLMDHPVKPTGDLDELRAIHRHLFQDVYDWAGELRTVDIRKNVEGAQFFLPVSMIGRAAGYAEGELRGMSREQFIDRLAYHYDQFNYVHPFREGNGRTQRVFWNRVARDAGWQLDWREVHGATVRLDQVGGEYDEVFPADVGQHPERYGALHSTTVDQVPACGSGALSPKV